MAPRLLDKKTINKEVAQQTKQQIESGLKMAKKVDAVRATLQEEQQHLEKFRLESVTRVQEEINGKIRERDSLTIDIARLKEERAREAIPLTKEWEQVNAQKAHIFQREIALAEREENCATREDILIGDEENMQMEKERIASLKERTNEKLNTAEEERIEARRILNKAKKSSEEKILKLHAKEQNLASTEEGLAAWEKSLEQRERAIQNSQLDIAKREQVLKDRYETLARDIKRLQ